MANTLARRMQEQGYVMTLQIGDRVEVCNASGDWDGALVRMVPTAALAYYVVEYDVKPRAWVLVVADKIREPLDEDDGADDQEDVCPECGRPYENL